MLPYINDFPMEFRDYIASEIIPQYAHFDKAHRVDHVSQVIAESLKLSQYYDVNRMMVYVIAAYHDLGLCEGREFHHLISGKILWADRKLRVPRRAYLDDERGGRRPPCIQQACPP